MKKNILVLNFSFIPHPPLILTLLKIFICGMEDYLLHTP
jgi:hypothetical protein